MDGITAAASATIGATAALRTSAPAAPAAPHAGQHASGTGYFVPGAPVPPPPDGFAFNPLQELLRQLQDLLRQLLGNYGPPKPPVRPPVFPPPPIKPPPVKPTFGVHVGQEVGVLETRYGKGPTGLASAQPIRVEDIIGEYTTEQHALHAAQKVSERNGEAVAVIATQVPDYPMNAGTAKAKAEYDRKLRANPNMPALPGGVPGVDFFPMRTVYMVVTLDPAVAPQYADRVQSFGPTRITHLVQGWGNIGSVQDIPQKRYPQPLPDPMPLPEPQPHPHPEPPGTPPGLPPGTPPGLPGNPDRSG